MKTAGLMYGISEGAKGFLDAYVKMRSLRNQETELEQKRLESEVDRKFREQQAKAQQAKTLAEMSKEGFVLTGDEWTQDPEFLKRRELKERAEIMGKGLRPVFDEAGRLTGYERDPEDPAAIFKKLSGAKLVSDIQDRLTGRDMEKQKFSAELEKMANERAERQRDFDLKMKEFERKGIESPYEKAQREKILAEIDEKRTGKKLSPLEQAEKEAEIEYKRAQAEKARREAKKAPQSVAQKAIDTKFSQDYIDWIGGDQAKVQKNINQLEEAINLLEKDSTLTGPIRGLLPDQVRSLTNPKAIAVKDTVAEVVQQSLKTILGGQFTEKEGALLIQRAYNDKLSTGENKKRVERLLNQLKQAAADKAKAAEYYEENGTLAGYKGPQWTIKNGELVKSSAPPSVFSRGETKEINGITYQRNEQGKWQRIK